jgi:H/ACA ribonucleoprotein complex subunit 4
MEKQTALLPFEKIKREVFTRKEAETSDKFGTLPERRSTAELINYGIVNIDKPRGPTSHQVSYYVQQILSIDKSGHSGTLDPNVTGILAIAVGNATKIVQALLTAGKEYVCLMHIHKIIDENKIREVISSFVGKIRQLPPIKSAVKREMRYRKIYYIEVLEIDGQDVLLKAGCQAGTYIRKLVHDIGQKLGCGAHMVELRRTKAGPFNESTALCTLHDLSDAVYYYKQENNDKYLRTLIQPIEKAIEHLARVWILDTTVNTLCHGASLKVPGISKVESDIQVGDIVAVMTLKNELVGFGRAEMISKEMQKQEKGIAVKMQRIFMQPGIYPKIEKKLEKK